jgi:hypothetical protein
VIEDISQLGAELVTRAARSPGRASRSECSRELRARVDGVAGPGRARPRGSGVVYVLTVADAARVASFLRTRHPSH